MARRPIPCILDDFDYVGFVRGQQRWTSDRGARIYTWDSLHGDVEVFNGRGKHLGAQGIRDAVPGGGLMSSQSDSFVSLALAGEVTSDAIDDNVDQWHQNPAGKPLHEYLGMTRDGYALWISSPDTLALILASRRLDKPLPDLAIDSLQSMRLAARTDDTIKLRRFEAW